MSEVKKYIELKQVFLDTRDNEIDIRNRNTVNERIEKILSIDGDFKLSIAYLEAVHKYLFKSVYEGNGEIRNFNITKAEPILNNDSVEYPDYHIILDYLKYDMGTEKCKDYKCMSKNKIPKELADFCLRIWNTHPFCEGNTRTVSVFMVKYLRHLGYDIDNKVFKERSYFFRNALVRASYVNTDCGVRPDKEPLILFFRSVLYNEPLNITVRDIISKELFVEDFEPKVRKRKK